MAELRVLKNAVKHNYELMNMLCLKNEAHLNVVSKFCLSNPKIIDFLSSIKDCPCTTISDSNMCNFALLNESLAKKLTKCVIKTRISDIQKIPELPPYARPDRIFVSDRQLLKELEKLPENLQPEVVLIAETGDMKDGFLLPDIYEICKTMPKIRIIGVSVNFSCLSGILPDLDTVRTLADLALKIQKLRNLERPFLSVGGTVVHSIAENGELKGLVQEIRSGEGIFFGYDSSGGQKLKDFCQKTIVLCGEILEVAEKDFSIQAGHTAGFSATGGSTAGIEEQNLAGKGKRKRAVLDFGVLAAVQKDLMPVDAYLVSAGQTFDFTVVDVTDSPHNYKAGEEIEFITNYGSASFAMMNRYIPCILAEE